MGLLKTWWNTSSKKEKTAQILVSLLVFTYSAYINNASISIATGLAAAYILYDCYQKKSFSGFRIARENWLGLAVFLGSVLLASLLLGDQASIRMSFKYVYWALPFLLAAYLGKLADIRYAAAVGALLSVAVSSLNVAYLNYLFLHGHKLIGPSTALVRDGRLGAFLNHPNHYSMLLICTLPLLLYFFLDKKLRSNPLLIAISITVTVLGLWSLWKTASRGAMISLFTGGLAAFALFCFFKKLRKQFLKGLAVGVAAVVVILLIGVQGGNRMYGDSARVRMWKSSYAMWQDHTLLGIGLNNWQKEHATNYILKDEIKQQARQQYLNWKKSVEQRVDDQKATAAKKAEEQKTSVSQNALAKKPATQKPKPQLTPEQKSVADKAAAKRDADNIAAWQKTAIKAYSSFDMPHNVIAWFFSTTGVIGGIGYLLFVTYYCRLLYSKMKENPGESFFYVGLWSFLAITIHGLVDAGITNKEAARLLFLVLGMSVNFLIIESGKYLKNQL